VLFNAAQHAQFGFDHQAFGVSGLDHAPGDFNIFIERFVAGINHDRTVKTALDTVVAGFLVAMVEMNGKNSIRENLIGRGNQAFEHFLVGIRARALANLDNERGLAVQVPTEQTHGLLEVVDVVCADCILTICCFKQLFGCDNHGGTLPFW